MPKTHAKIAASAEKMSTAKINVGSYISTILKLILPLLGPALASLLQKPGWEKYRTALIDAREVLIAADLGDD